MTNALYRIPLNYILNTENNIKFLLNDGKKQKFIFLSLYSIRNSWYLDVSDNDSKLLIGRLINTWTDLFDILKIYDKNFPKLKLLAMPSNINGINKDFKENIAGTLQELFLVGDE